MPHKDPVVRAEYFRRYRDENRDLLRERDRASKAKNATRIKAMKADEYRRHREDYLRRSKERWTRRKDELNAYRRTPEFKAKKNVKRKQWWATRPLWERKYYSGLAQAYSRDHAQLGDQKEAKEWYRITFSEQEHVGCAYCDKVILSALACVDHKQPYKFGGKHEAGNLAACCKDCNNMKGATPWEVWSAFLDKKRGGLLQ